MPPKGKSRKNTTKSEPTKNLSEKNKDDQQTVEEVPDNEAERSELPAAVKSKPSSKKNKKAKNDEVSEKENSEPQVNTTTDKLEAKVESKPSKKTGKQAKKMDTTETEKSEGSADEKIEKESEDAKENSHSEDVEEEKSEEKKTFKTGGKGKKKAQKPKEAPEPPIEEPEPTAASPNPPKKKSKKENAGESSKKQKKAAPKPEDSSDDDFETPKPSTSKKSSKTGPSAEEKGPKPPNRSILQLKVVLRYIDPPIWRRIQVLNNDTFDSLHGYLQEAMGWQGNHSYQFVAFNEKTKKEIFLSAPYMMDFGDKPQPKASQVKLSRYLNYKGDRVVYVYDLGDNWEHDVIVERVLPPPPPKAEYPKIKAGKRACPPEDCGSYDGYNHLLEVYRNPQHEEYEELITDWLGDVHPGWKPEKFDKKKIFRRVWMWLPA